MIDAKKRPELSNNYWKKKNNSIALLQIYRVTSQFWILAVKIAKKFLTE